MSKKRRTKRNEGMSLWLDGELMGGGMDEKNSKVVRETFDTRNNRTHFHLLSNTL
jgi:hypothetical protein